MKKPLDTLVSQALSLLPYLLTKGEVSLSQAASDLRLPGRQVKQLVRLLQFCGLPPYGGGDTFDCYLQGASIHLETARGAPPRPARLTHAEALALALGAHLAGELVPGAAVLVGSLREKLSLATAAVQELEVPISVEGEPPWVTGHIPLLRSAAAERKVVRISYYSLNSARTSERLVEPWRLYYYRGHWYLLAYCRLRGRDTVFRLDRVREAVLTGDTFTYRSRRIREPTPSYGSSLLEVDILVPEEEARSLEERGSPFLKNVQYLPEGMARIRVVSDSLPWVVGFVLKYGGEALVEAPEEVRRAVLRAAEEILRRYPRQQK